MSNKVLSNINVDTTLDSGLVPVYNNSVEEFRMELIPDHGVKVYTALLSQTGTDVPTANILQNTLGDVPVWTRTSAGLYVATLAGAFGVNNTFVSLLIGGSTLGTLVAKLSSVTDDTVVLQFSTSIVTVAADLSSNSTPTYIEIKVYPAIV